MYAAIFTILVLASCITTFSIPAIVFACYHDGSFQPRKTRQNIRHYGTACILATPILWSVSLAWFLLCVAAGVPM